MAAEQPPLDPQMMRQQEQANIAQVGEVLGLHPSFIEDAISRGQTAVIERIMQTDETGGSSRVMALAQRVAIFMEEQIISGAEMDTDDLLDAVEDFAEQLEIHPGIAVELMGPVLEIYEQTTHFLSRKAAANGIGLLSEPQQGTEEGLAPTAQDNSGLPL